MIKLNTNEDRNDKREIFAYIRVSTGNQESGILSQQHAIQQYCKNNGIEKYKIYQDENVSGSKTSRPALDDMMEEIKKGNCKHLVVFAFSRFSRSCSHLLKSLELLESYKCRFSSVSEQIDTSTIIGKTLVAVLGALAQMERELIVQRVRAGLARAKAEGRHIGRKKTRPSSMIQKVLARGVTYREAAHLCNISQGSVALEAKEMRKSFRGGHLPEHLTIDDIRHSTFFAGEKQEHLDLVIANSRKKIILDHLPPLPVIREPIAEMQPVSTIVHRKTN
jgi:DNA invertase Pin-like site-specific DNA recombinase